MKRFSRWLVPLPAVLFSFYPLAAHAEPVAGLNAVGYKITSAPPNKSDLQYVSCGSETENNINRNFDGEPFQQCGADWFMVHYTGFITIPENQTISFKVAADDGGTVKIGETEFGTWNNKGCSWSAETSTVFVGNSYLLDGWFYEAGGLTCFMLAWNINDQGWQIVPDSAFTSSAIATTTTTLEVSTTTTSLATTSTSTLLVETSTTTSTTQLPTSTTSSTTTTTVLVPTQTTTTTLFLPVLVSPISEPITQALPQEVATVPLPQIETTVQTLPTTTVRLETTTSLETFVTSLPMPETSTVRATLETIKPTTSLLPAKELPTTTKASDQPTEPAKPLTTLPADAPQGVLSPVSVATLPAPPLANPKATELIGTLMKDKKDDAPQPIDQKVFVEVIKVLSVASPEQIVAIVGEIVQSDLNQTQSLELATTPAVLEAITETQAEQVFEKIVPELLSDQEAEQFILAVQDAPTKVKKAFEKTLDIFGSQFESYVAVGSSIPVSQRRSLVAVGSLMTMLPPPVKRFR